ncbi:MarR family winged helix-turn-helix transcriptional regulator [Microbacterium sp. GXF6406]
MTSVSAPGSAEASAPSLSEEYVAALTDLESEFGELITHFRHTVTENAERLSPGLLPTAYKTFTTIVRYESTTASVLVDALQMDKGQLSRTLRELEGLGLIARTPDPSDRRATLLSPTPDGITRLAEARRPQEGRMLRALSNWDLSELQTLTALLHRLTTGAREA